MSTFRPDQIAPDPDRLNARKDVQTTLRAYAAFLADPAFAHRVDLKVLTAIAGDTKMPVRERRRSAEMLGRLYLQALDKAGDEAAANAISEIVRQLKLNPVITVSVAPESISEVERRMEQLRRQGLGANLAFVPNAEAKPGDWTVVWGEGSAGFSRQGIEATIEAIINARLQDPVAPQLELFSA